MPENARGDYAPPNSPFEGILHLRRDDDMYDSMTELENNSPLARALRILAEICRPYWAANDLAITQGGFGGT